jgi:hypothetical protein
MYTKLVLLIIGNVEWEKGQLPITNYQLPA